MRLNARFEIMDGHPVGTGRSEPSVSALNEGFHNGHVSVSGLGRGGRAGRRQ